MYKDKAKKLVKRVKNVVSKLIRVNRLANNNIKVTVTNRETKTALLKNIK